MLTKATRLQRVVRANAHSEPRQATHKLFPLDFRFCARSSAQTRRSIVCPHSLRKHASLKSCYTTKTPSVSLLKSGDFSSPRPTHKCGDLSEQNIGQTVGLAGWLSSIRFLGQNLAFVVVRDSIGTTQVKVEVLEGDKEGQEVLELLRHTPLESIIYLKGKVNARPSETVNKDMSTGTIEVEAREIEILNRAENLPLPYHRSTIEVGSEEMRLKHRYLDLRQPSLQRNIRLRSTALQAVRSFLVGTGFCEIETPTLFRKTSEGAREYIVPTRQPNKFYTLTQSPQQYKQLLMASGFDRYFQIARCYRDEDLRADRQPEFTQIDMELAFIQQDDIKRTIEGLLANVFKSTLGVNIPTPFPEHTYKWCMDNYGSDKPDTRFDMKLLDVTEDFAKTTKIGVISSALSKLPEGKGFVKAINLKGIGKMNEKDIDTIQMEAKKSSSGVLTVSVNEDGKLKSSIAKYLSESEEKVIREKLDLKPGDLVLIACGTEEETWSSLGRLRLWARDRKIANGTLQIPADRYDLFWVVDFPLFTWEDGKMLSTHHPFTAPVSEDAHMLSSHPEKVRGQHYDVVLNGYEIGGGSIRIHKKEEQIKVLRDVIGMSADKVAEFQHLLDALGHGCPPHGGIALGFDRLMAVLVGAKSLREVIAFPKSSSGAEIMTGAPATLGPSETKELYEVVKAAKEMVEKANKQL